MFVRDWPRIAGQHLSDCLFAPRSSSKCLSSASSNPSRFCGAGDANGVRTLQSSSTPQRVCCSSLTDCRSLSRPNGAIPALRRPPVRRQLPESPFYWVHQRLELEPWLASGPAPTLLASPAHSRFGRILGLDSASCVAFLRTTQFGHAARPTHPANTRLDQSERHDEPGYS